MKITNSETDKIKRLLHEAQLRSEKCELAEARELNREAFDLARSTEQYTKMIHALSQLFRLASEALDSEATESLQNELQGMIDQYPDFVPVWVWYGKAAVAFNAGGKIKEAQGYFHKYLRLIRQELRVETDKEKIHELEYEVVRAWTAIATCLWNRGLFDRASVLARIILKKIEDHESEFRGIAGTFQLMFGLSCTETGKFDEAEAYLRKAQMMFMREHNWFYYLFVMTAYSRLATRRGQRDVADWYLNLVEQALTPEMGSLRREVQLRRKELEDGQFDFILDVKNNEVSTRDQGKIKLGKQYVLFHILEALSSAHSRDATDLERGVSKEELIRMVWKEDYRPEVHNNKLYYNINRLRKLIELDPSSPKILLNWKEGYRLAPALKVQIVGRIKEIDQERGGNYA